jgi:hypothetical protein
MLVSTANLLSKPHETTPREIELWMEHVGPVWRGSLDAMKAAVAKWDAAMRAEGLLPAERKMSMDSFLYGDGAVEA